MSIDVPPSEREETKEATNDGLPNESCGSAEKKEEKDTKPPSKTTAPKVQERRARLKATLRSMYEVDHTQIAFVPGMRTAVILMIEWAVFGIGNPTTTAFQLGCLFVGFTDPNGNLSRRLHSMGLTLLTTTIVGSLLPGLVWEYPILHFVLALLVALATGLSPLLDSHSLFLSMKLATALFAINGGVNRNTEGYGGLGISLGWTAFGGSVSLMAALLPEIIGTRDAVRTDLFKVFHGCGWNLQRWSAHWGTSHHVEVVPVPFITISMSKTQDRIYHDVYYCPEARDWLLRLMERADGMRCASLCLSNAYEMAQRKLIGGEGEEMDDLFRMLGITCRRIGMALQFPWLIKTCWRRRLQDAPQQLQKAVTILKSKVSQDLESGIVQDQMTWFPALLDLLQMEVDGTVHQVLDRKNWPPRTPLCNLSQRIREAFPANGIQIKPDPNWVIRGYALRYAFAFGVASIPELVMPRDTSAHWFPMTVALIMGPTQAGTFPKVVSRTVGTLLGIGLGSALYPLFEYPTVLIFLLGLNTYLVCLYFSGSYVWFTFFITGWVFCTTVGAGADVGVTILYRCLWTLAAAALVTVVTFTYPPKSESQVSEKLADMVKAIKAYAQAVLEEHQLRRSILRHCGKDHKLGPEEALTSKDPTLLHPIQGCEEEEATGNSEEANDNNTPVRDATSPDNRQEERLQKAQDKVKQTRKVVIQARVTMLTCINDAVLTPTEPTLVDPHSVASAMSSDLIDAVVVPQFVSLVDNECSGDLLADVEASFNDQTFAEMDRLVLRLELKESSTVPKNTESIPHTTGKATNDRSPIRFHCALPIAIAHAHKRLDDAGVPG